MIIATNLLVGIIEAKKHIGDKKIITKSYKSRCSRSLYSNQVKYPVNIYFFLVFKCFEEILILAFKSENFERGKRPKYALLTKLRGERPKYLHPLKKSQLLQIS